MTTYVGTQPLVGRAARPRIFTRAYTILLLVAAIGMALIAWRFVVGLGTATAMSDGYPLGLWIVFDVVTGTALACGGYALAFLVYIFNKGRYHPLVRPAILTSALGYSIAGFSVMIDVGRPWLAWKIPIKVWTWNLNSVLLEVAVCIMAYVVVLWIELSPAFFEKYKDRGPEKLQVFSRRALAFFDKALIWIVALGMLLPTMHQSSLGSLMMLAGPRLHPLWLTAFLPLFFLITCISMGYAVVVAEAAFSSRAFGHKAPVKMLLTLGRFAAAGTLLFVVARFIDLAFRGRLAATMRFDLYGVMFWIETALFVIPFLMLMRREQSLGRLLRAAMIVAFGGAVYRFDTFLVAFDPGPGWAYFPSVAEQLITIGLIAAEIAVYVAIVKYFPILGGAEGEAA